jgi:hypothetical protein
VAVGYGGLRLRSLDAGKTWGDEKFDVEEGGDDEWLIRCVAHGNGQFVAAGYHVHTSTDGANWKSSGKMDQWIGGVAFAEGKWVAAGGYGLRATSVDGMDYQRIQSGGNVTNAFRTLGYDETFGRWIAVGDEGIIQSTADGEEWVAGEGSEITARLFNIAVGNGITVAAARTELVVSNDGGLTWGSYQQIETGIFDLAYADDGFVATSRDAVLTSPDGVDWTRRSVEDMDGQVGCHGAICVTLSARRAFRSEDSGVTWQPTATFDPDLQEILEITSGPIP